MPVQRSCIFLSLVSEYFQVKKVTFQVFRKVVGKKGKLGIKKGPFHYQTITFENDFFIVTKEVEGFFDTTFERIRSPG